jgi:hypothetical protein
MLNSPSNTKRGRSRPQWISLGACSGGRPNGDRHWTGRPRWLNGSHRPVLLTGSAQVDSHQILVTRAVRKDPS